jgi:hypothetical protein
VILRLGSTKSIWFERDENNYVLLNIKMPTLSGEPRARIENNVWSVLPRLTAEVICPPNGRLIDVKYNNGDWFRVEYQIMATEDDFFKNYPGTPVSHLEEVVFPLTLVNVYATTAGSRIQLTPTSTTLPGVFMTGGWIVGNGVIFSFGIPPEAEARLFAAYGSTTIN